MATSTVDLHQRERAEIQRSGVEAGLTGARSLLADERNLARYLDPPASTPFPLEFAYHLLGNIEGKVVLDFGCGAGENAVILARRGARVHGIDISKSLIDLAKARMAVNGLAGRASFIVSSAHDLALPANSVDVVLGIAILHHLDLALVAREVRRVLRPGGRAIFQEPVRTSRAVRFVRSLIPYKAPDISPFERPLTDRELADFARDFSACRARPFMLPFVNVAQAVPFLRRYVPAAYRLDGRLLGGMPWLAHFAGIRVIEVVK